jgi:hypothetical protein
MKAMASVYRAVVQAVLLYGSESWVTTIAIKKKLEAFHHKCARNITGQHIKENTDGSWTYPPSTKVLETAGLSTIKEYIQKQKEYMK